MPAIYEELLSQYLSDRFSSQARRGDNEHAWARRAAPLVLSEETSVRGEGVQAQVPPPQSTSVPHVLNSEELRKKDGKSPLIIMRKEGI